MTLQATLEVAGAELKTQKPWKRQSHLCFLTRELRVGCGEAHNKRRFPSAAEWPRGRGLRTRFSGAGELAGDEGSRQWPRGMNQIQACLTCTARGGTCRIWMLNLAFGIRHLFYCLFAAHVQGN